jgi:hypothetical protein
MRCANCHHHDHEHANHRGSTGCTVRYGAFGDNSFLEVPGGERCWCTGWRPQQ